MALSPRQFSFLSCHLTRERSSKQQAMIEEGAAKSIMRQALIADMNDPQWQRRADRRCPNGIIGATNVNNEAQPQDSTPMAR